MPDNSSHYKEIFLNDLPLMDVRAPVEFNKGAFPQAHNLPLMDDDERREVGTCFKQKGRQAAIELGHRLVAGALKAERIAAWANFAGEHPEGYLYCFRGGLRSQFAQQWLRTETGLDYPRIPGGYKAMRNFLIETTASTVAASHFILVGGLTGSGKTELLTQLDNAVDLEEHAHHRGSSFGRHAEAQPTQINFENTLAIDLLKQSARGRRVYVLEDEGRMIGHCALPLVLHQAMLKSPLVWLEDGFAHRAKRILRDYVIDLCAEFIALHGREPGFIAFSEHLRLSLRNIAKRLGMERYQRLAAMMDAALNEQQRNGAVDGHLAWIKGLLGEYYDPMYAYQRNNNADRIIFRGDRRAVLAYLRQNHL